MNFTILLGALIVLAGLSNLLDAVFHLHLPLVRSALAGLLLFFGVKILVEAWGPSRLERSGTGAVVMSDRRFSPTDGSKPLKYDLLFGRALIDLTQLPWPQTPIPVQVNALFSSAVVTVDPSWPMVVEATAAFGDVRMPDKSVAAFGTATYQPKGQFGPPLIRLSVNGVFGSVQIVESRGSTVEPPSMAHLHPGGLSK